jgi:diaminohydroxyphosphoribosylaminopyrimidine deaminase/5-amino-6-(5-phosphoribosylamino)uracil reductase
LKKNTRQPIRLLWDPDLKISPKAKLISQKQAGPTWIFTFPKNSRGIKAARLKSRGVEIVPCPSPRKKIPVKKILSLLGKRGMQSLLVEGGPGVWTEFFRQHAVQELCLFIAPKILGAEARPWIGPLGQRALPRPLDWKFLSWEKIGPDLLMRWRLP